MLYLSEARYFSDSNPVALERTVWWMLSPHFGSQSRSYTGKTFGRCSMILSELLASSRAGSPLNLTDRKCVWTSRVPYNKLLTNLACSSRTGEYWPSVVFVRTSLRSVCTATTSGQYFPVRPSRSVGKRLLLLGPVIQSSIKLILD